MRITVDPVVPACEGGGAHRWNTSGEVQAGPSGLGITWTDTCACGCGWTRTTETGAQCPETGERGFEAVSYARDAGEPE